METGIVITTQTIITSGAVLTALISIFTIVFKIHNWYIKQENQDKKIQNLGQTHDTDVRELKEEQRVICEGLIACLDGLEQLGCNHSVPKAKSKLENHLNTVAHK